MTAVKIYMTYNFHKFTPTPPNVQLHKPLHILYFSYILLTNESLEVSTFNVEQFMLEDSEIYYFLFQFWFFHCTYLNIPPVVW